MQKKLTTAGNSLALVIDRPLQRMLGLQKNRRVWLRIEGTKLVIEAVRDEPGAALHAAPAAPAAPVTPPADLEALRVHETLMNKHDMWEGRFRTLNPAAGSMVFFGDRLRRGWASSATDDGRAALRRFETCLELLEAGLPWEAAMNDAIRRFPIRPTTTTS